MMAPQTPMGSWRVYAKVVAESRVVSMILPPPLSAQPA